MGKKYRMNEPFKPSSHRRRLAVALISVAVVLLICTVAVRRFYYDNLRPVSSSDSSQTVEIPKGAGIDQITEILDSRKLIRSPWAFKLYVRNQDAASVLQAGTYALSPSMSVNQIVAAISHGKVVTDLVTILPGQTLAQIKKTFISAGYSEEQVTAAFDPSYYSDVPVLIDKPGGANLEGFLYPDSFQKNSSTNPQALVTASLTEMQKYLTPELRQKFAAQGLSTYQGLILASIVEKEVSRESDRPVVAQVFLSRLRQNISLGSDVTAFYGADLAGQPRSVRYDSPFNTRLHPGLPPTPIGTVSQSSLKAVANPANTDWLFFVTGDDGTTHFSHTVKEHQALVTQYCHKLCQ
ncbi:MAG: endolytic transglycosylase MltG [Candidatus Saccharibacteria bacterium]|nr:endolytic transglycosylase MltG [Candidatus Saccharibacteria bacterium]